MISAESHQAAQDRTSSFVLQPATPKNSIDRILPSTSWESGREDIGHQLSKLQHFLMRSLEQEEQLMRAMNYPDIEKHCREHRDLLDVFLIIRIKLERRQTDFRLVWDLFAPWVANHTREFDAPFRDFLRDVPGIVTGVRA